MSGVDERPVNCDFEVIVVENQTDTNTNNQTQPPDKEETRKKRAVDFVEPRVTHINLSINLSNSFLDACMTE